MEGGLHQVLYNSFTVPNGTPRNIVICQIFFNILVNDLISVLTGTDWPCTVWGLLFHFMFFT